MDRGAKETSGASATDPSAAPASRTRSARRSRLGRELTTIWVVVALLLGGVGVGGWFLYRQLYSPSAFVEQYLGLLAQGRAADALALPGVGVSSQDLSDAGLPGDASQALLRRDALTALTEIERVSEHAEGGVTQVTVEYRAGGAAGTTTFAVEQAGWIGIVPAWRFASTPLSTVSLRVNGSESFEVNGFELDKRQISPLGVEADPRDRVSMLVFSPGLYRVAVETPLATTAPVDVLADAPLTDVPLALEAEATTEFVDAVQGAVDDFLDACATQEVLNPTGCPFGYTVRNRILDVPAWSIAEYPSIRVLPDGAAWTVPPTEAVARIDVDIQSLFDGTVRRVSEDVPFQIDAVITVSADGRASVHVGTPGDDVDDAD